MPNDTAFSGQPKPSPLRRRVGQRRRTTVHSAHDSRLFLMCDDIEAFIAEMKKRKVKCSPVDEQRWGSITRLALPGGGTLGIYQPKHPSPLKAKTT